MTFWKGKTVLVTGAGGFIASHLVELLMKQEAKVRAFVRYNSRNDPGLLSLLPPATLHDIELIAGDLRDLQAVQSAIRNVDIVFHLGALITIPYSYLHPLEVVETNVIGTVNILMACRDFGVQRLVHTSTSEVYGTALSTPIDESHPLQGQSPYSASKIGADKLAESFYKSYDTPVVTIRPFNTYGPRQTARAVIPTIITQALSQQTVNLGNLNASRDLTYISDTVAGILKSAEISGIEGETINLGSGYEIQIGELAREIISIIGKPVEIVVDNTRLRPDKSEVQRLLSDNSKAKRILRWETKIPLTQGLEMTIEWIKQNLDRYQIGIYEI
ncbi:MAG: GDP-mannose 4,6-dehydratase [Anaerolineales bacterium]